MKQKTAMMELIEHIKTIWSNQGWEDTVIEKATQLLEKEKEQIINAYDASQMEEWTDEDGLRWLSFYADANQYYNWKYKKD